MLPTYIVARRITLQAQPLNPTHPTLDRHPTRGRGLETNLQPTPMRLQVGSASPCLTAEALTPKTQNQNKVFVKDFEGF